MMASLYNRKQIEDILMCSVCLEVFTNPKLLPCFHTFCEECIKSLPNNEVSQEKHGILCPLCTSFTDETNHKTHYMAEEFVQLYRNINTSDKTCSLCELENNTAKWHCIEACCRIDLCDNCQRIHLKTPYSKAHRVVPSEDGAIFLVNRPIKCSKHDEQDTHFYCESCNILICMVCKASTHATHRTQDVDDVEKKFKRDVQKKLDIIADNTTRFEKEIEQNEKIVSEIEKENQVMIDQLEQKKRQFITKIDTQLAKERNVLQERKSELEKNVKQLKTKYKSQIKENNTLIKFTQATLENSKSSNFVQEMIDGLGSKVTKMSKATIEKKDQIRPNKLEIKANGLIENCDNLLGNITETKPGIKEHAKNLTAITNYKMLSVFIIAIVGILIAASLSQTQNDTFTNPRFIDGNITEALMNITKSKGERIANFRKAGYKRMAYINNTFWLLSLMHNNIQVFTVAGEELPAINFPGYNKLSPCAVIQVQENVVIMASDEGLFSLNISGHIQYQLSAGDYTDVNLDGNYLVALKIREGLPAEIEAYSYHKNKWKHETTFETTNLRSSTSYNKRLILKNKTIYLSSGIDDIIQYYSLEEKALSETHDSKGRDKPGQLVSPTINLLDKYGSVLISDWERLQVLTADGRWKVYKLEGITQPYDVLMVDNYIYVLWRNLQNSNFHTAITRYKI